MKKLLAITLVFATLLLVSCGERPPTPPGEKTTPKLYGVAEFCSFCEAPSRIVFTDDSGVGIQNYYYSKADGMVYPFCFDPLCEHKSNTGCLAWDVGLFYDGPICIGNRFYYRHYKTTPLITIETCYSCAFDGSDIREEFTFRGGMTHFLAIRGIVPTDRYIYAFTTESDGTRGVLRYDTQTRELLDVSEELKGLGPNGLYMEIGIVYVFGDKCFFNTTEMDVSFNDTTLGTMPTVFEQHYYEANLDFSDKKESELAKKLFVDGYARGVFFEDTVCTRFSGWREDNSIRTLNVSTGEETVFYAADLGFANIQMIGFDGEYCYFHSTDNRVIKGKDEKGREIYNNYGGKYYRVKPDGSDLMLVCELSNFDSPGSMILFDNKVLILGNTYYVDEAGKVKYTNKDKAGNVQDCLWEATIQADGTWSPLTKVPYVFEE